MFNEKKKEDLFFQLIRDEIKNREGKEEKEQELKLKPSIIQGVINQDMPFYEDHLKQILIQETQTYINKTITQVKHDVEIEQAEIKRNYRIQKKKEKEQEQVKAHLLDTQQPGYVYQNLQQNIVTFINNFTQMISLQVTNNVKGQLKKKHRKRKIKERQERSEHHEKKKKKDEGYLQTQNQPSYQELVSKQQEQKSRPDTPGFRQKQNESPQQIKRQQTIESKQEDSYDQFYDDDFEQSMPQKEEKKQQVQIEKKEEKKVEVQPRQREVTEDVIDDYYEDDFAEESGYHASYQQKSSFQQQSSNFYKGQQQKQQKDDDFMFDDIEELLD